MTTRDRQICMTEHGRVNDDDGRVWGYMWGIDHCRQSWVDSPVVNCHAAVPYHVVQCQIAAGKLVAIRHDTCWVGVPFDVCSALLLLPRSHLQSVWQNVNRNTGPISVRKATDSFMGNFTQKDRRKHCKTLQWQCWIGGSQPPQWQWKFDGRNNTSSISSNTFLVWLCGVQFI